MNVQERLIELAIIFRLALPTMVTQFLRYLNPSVSIVVCGHLSREELDAASLASTVINVLGLSIDTGFSSAFDTLFSQAYGSQEKDMLRVFLQRGLTLSMLLYSLLACIHLNIEPFLLLLGQDPLISSLTAEYLTAFLPGLACDFLFLTFARYLQSQCIVLPMFLASLVGTVFNVAAQYYFIVHLKMGLWTSAMCLSCAFACMLAVELAYIVLIRGDGKLFRSIEINRLFSNWGIIFRLGIPGLLMVALEEWCFEMMTLIAGTIDEVNLGAQAITFQIQSVIYMLPLGVFTAVNIRVGQNLGAFNPNGARLTFTTALMIIPLICLTSSIPVLILRHQLPKIFTADEAIRQLTSKLLPMLIYFQLCEGFSGVSEAVLLACGRQNLGAFIIFIGYYCIGMPIATTLAYKTGLGLLGAWIGLAVGFGIASSVYTWFAVRTEWAVEARRAYSNVHESMCIDDQLPLVGSALTCEMNQHGQEPNSSSEAYKSPLETQNELAVSPLNGYPSPFGLKKKLFLLLVGIIWFSCLYSRMTMGEPLWRKYCRQHFHLVANGTTDSHVERSAFCNRMLNTYRSIDPVLYVDGETPPIVH